ncbi:MAG: lipoate--protein ligase family protein [Candidatus Micrarchaeota archaeon]|nr:lipoate--protein ligase family protein [Candidatus Micrarchaeota archaeon]
MAADQAISEAVSGDDAPATIRFYTWKPSAVSIGCFQSMKDEVNIERCRELDVDWVRRRTGGGAVFHDASGELTYSVIAKEHHLPAGIHESYRHISAWIIDGLKSVGIEATYAPINDIVVQGRKISGNAQTRREGIFLQHGTILYDLDVMKMFSVLKVDAAKISDKMVKSVEERVTKVLNHADITQEELYDAMLKSFTDGKEYSMGAMSENELTRTKELAETVYKTDAWNFSR